MLLEQVTMQYLVDFMNNTIYLPSFSGLTRESRIQSPQQLWIPVSSTRMTAEGFFYE